MYNNFDSGYFISCRDVIRHPSVISAPVAYRWVLLTIMDRASFEVQEKDDHGIIISLEVGQLLCTIRQLAEWANVDKNEAERAVSRFLKVGILRQEVRHTKTLLTLTFPITYKQMKHLSETRSETKVRQDRDRNNKENKENKEKLTTTKPPPIKEMVVVFSSLENVEMAYEEKVRLCKDFCESDVNHAVNFLNSQEENFIPESMPGYLRWAAKERPLILPKKSEYPLINKTYALKRKKEIMSNPRKVEFDILNKECELCIPGARQSFVLKYEMQPIQFTKQLDEELERCGVSNGKIEDITQANEA